MPAASALVDILIVLLAAKVAAEAAERCRLPAVAGEILAGIVIGPSVLGLVGSDEIITVLGELGVILLLLSVGLEMDLGELGAVGKAALSVAVIGVVVPFATGAGAGLALGFSGIEAVFVGAALTATSVGISARVFGDLRALATVEARTVLGAAVADDVLGLVVLTVVVRLAEAGSVSVTEVGSVVVVAAGFLVVALFVGIRLVPPLFAAVGRYSRSPGTLVAVALAFTLAVAQLASAAKLAPIIGAFIAGVSLARSPVGDRVRRELAPVGHLFVPVFFLQIGIDANVDQFVRPEVLGIAGVLLVVAVVGKLVSVLGLAGAPGDWILVGVGMIPRGEVGLIFATIGLRAGVFGGDVYAALLLVVLVTTLATPPALRFRLLQLRRARPADRSDSGGEPPGGWLAIAGDEVELVARPPAGEALEVALRAAIAGEHGRPGARLLDWSSGLPDDPLPWSAPARAAFHDLLARGGARAWRFLTVTGVLARALPELDAAVASRAADAFDLDPAGSLRWPRLARLRELGGLETTAFPDRVALAAVLLDAAGVSGDTTAPDLARAVGDRIGLGDESTVAVTALVGDVELLQAAALRPSAFEEEAVLQLAAHLGSVDHVRSVHLLIAADDGVDADDRAAVEALADLVDATLSQRGPLTDSGSVEERRRRALALVEGAEPRDALDHAPRAYVLTQAPVDLARQAVLCSPTPGRGQVRVQVTATADDAWRVEVAAADRLGLLAHETRVLGDAGLDVVDAVVATWPDGCALSVFRVRAFEAPSAERLREAMIADLAAPLTTPPTPDVELAFDHASSPWHTVCRVAAGDRYGLLALVTAAFAAAGVSVHAARIDTVDGVALDEFELTSPAGAKLTSSQQAAVCAALAGGVTAGRRRRPRPRKAVPGSLGGSPSA